MQHTTTRTAPVHRLGVIAFAVAVVSGVLALYGSLMAESHLAGSPLNEARKQEGLEVTRTSQATRYGIQFAAFVLPMILGIGATLLGGETMRTIEKSNGAFSGNLWAVFAMMIGGLAAVVAGCMSAAMFAWTSMPSIYTS